MPPPDAAPDAPEADASDAMPPVDAAPDSSAPDDASASDGGPTGAVQPHRLSLSDGHACFVKDDGSVVCWGANPQGQLGTGASGANQASPVSVVGLAGLAAEAAAGGVLDDGHSLALLLTGAVAGWGDNSLAQLGDGSQMDRLAPTPPLLTGAVARAIRTSFSHTCVLLADATVSCWGGNFYAQAGVPGGASVVLQPTAVPLPASAIDLSLGAYFNCALLSDATVACWGRNDTLQLGNTGADSTTPALVAGLGPVQTVGAGYRHACAMLQTGEVRCWGDDSSGQLGPAATGQSAVPIAVTGLGGTIVSLCGGSGHSCALSQAGGVQCWGWNYRGQLGNGMNTDSATPVPVTGLGSGVAEIACGGEFACARLAAGGVRCWGGNYNGELGDGTSMHQNVPVAVLGL
jgi:alpha-tubulin suppressor-like RCC1 family protein